MEDDFASSWAPGQDLSTLTWWHAPFYKHLCNLMLYFSRTVILALNGSLEYGTYSPTVIQSTCFRNGA